jgi:hypothetical protein
LEVGMETILPLAESIAERVNETARLLRYHFTPEHVFPTTTEPYGPFHNTRLASVRNNYQPTRANYWLVRTILQLTAALIQRPHGILTRGDIMILVLHIMQTMRLLRMNVDSYMSGNRAYGFALPDGRWVNVAEDEKGVLYYEYI